MHQNALLKLFPPPEYLRMSAVGLDLSDRSVKFVELVETRSGLGLGRYDERSIPEGVMEHGEIKDRDALKKVLASLVSEYKLSYVIASLPEEKGYVADVTLPFVSRKLLHESIELQIESHIPLPAAETVFDYELSGEPHEGATARVIISAFPKAMSEGYLSVMKEVGLTVRGFEIESHALARSLVPENDPDAYLVVDFGRTRTGFSVVSGGQVQFTSTAAVGGGLLNKSLMEKLNVSEQDARQLKEEKGLSLFGRDKELFAALVPVVSVLKDEIVKYYNYWTTKNKGVDGQTKIKKILMCGGDANMPGLIEYLSKGQIAPIERANPWVNILSFERQIPAIRYEESLRYATALGLALRGQRA